MTVKELIAKLQKQNPDADITVAVGWAEDTAISDEGEDLSVDNAGDGTVTIEGWMSDCGASLDDD